VLQGVLLHFQRVSHSSGNSAQHERNMIQRLRAGSTMLTGSITCLFTMSSACNERQITSDSRFSDEKAAKPSQM
jgi:hypothetical protein